MTQEYDPRTAFTRRAGLGLGVGVMAGALSIGGLEWGLHNGHRQKPKPVALSIGPKPFAAKPQPALQHWPSLDALAQTMVDTRYTPGVSISVMHDGVFLYSKGFGLANIADNAPTTPQSPYRIASITKQFTASAILLLAEAGKLGIDDRLSRFIPEFPRGQDMSLRQMMSHTSGLGDYINGASHRVLVEAQHRDYSDQDILAIISSCYPLFYTDPGLAWFYSNSAFTLLGMVVERVSGLSLSAFFQQHMFTPAGMAHTAIDPTCGAAEQGCSGYRPAGSAGFTPNVPVSPSFIGGAGAIRSTTEDLCRWHDALLSGRILSAASLNAMFSPARLLNGQVAWEQGAHERLLYGFGMGLGMLGTHPVIAHGGRLNGFTGQLRSLPVEKISVACLYNCDGTGIGGYLPAEQKLRKEAVRLGLLSQGMT